MRSVSVITGGAGGMGLATARIVGRDHYVVICDLKQERLDRAVHELHGLGVEGEGVVCDITDRGAVDRLLAQAGESGHVASVVHTAGLSPSMGDAELIVRVNAVGTVNVNEAFLSIASDGGSIVNVASTAGHLPSVFPIPTRVYQLAFSDLDRFVGKLVSRCNLVPERLRPGLAYSLSKNFVIWYARKRVTAFGQKGARIISVSPGSFDTEMGRLEEQTGAAALAGHAALKRYGTVDEIAAVLAFCASDRPGYLTGTDVLVDGGASASMTMRDMLAMARNA